LTGLYASDGEGSDDKNKTTTVKEEPSKATVTNVVVNKPLPTSPVVVTESEEELKAYSNTMLPAQSVDSSYNSFSKYNFLFYFIYKYKYESRMGMDEPVPVD